MKYSLSIRIALVIAFICTPLTLHASGTLSLLTTHKLVTAGDAGSFMRPNWDYDETLMGTPARAINTTVIPNKSVAFKVDSWSDNSMLHLKFYIPDKTISSVGSVNVGGICDTSTLCLGDRIIVHIDPNNSGHKTTNPTTTLENGTSNIDKDHRYILVLKNNNVSSLEHFIPRNATAWNATTAYTAAATVPALGQPVIVVNEYQVELRIPYSDIGISSPPTGNIGIAIAVINDLGVPLYINGNDTPQLTGSAFPLSMPIDVSNSPNPEPQVVGSAPENGVWAKPNHWGVGYFSSTPQDSLTIEGLELPHGSIPWFSTAIRLSKCNVASWDDVQPAPTTGDQSNLTGWYKYYPSGPCQMGVWVNAKYNQITLNKNIEGRLLILWADTFVGTTGSVFKWSVIRLTDTMVFPPQLDTITREIWENVPLNGSYGGGTTHPCLRVYLLPAILDSVDSNIKYDETRIREITTSLELTQLERAYKIAPNIGDGRSAQMNFTNLAPKTGPDSTCTDQCVFDDVLSLSSAKKMAGGKILTTGKTAVVVKNEGEPQDPPSNDPLVRVDITGFGIAASSQARNYVFLEPIGGFGWVAQRTNFTDAQTVKFALGNPTVLWRDFTGATPRDIPSPPREIVLGVSIATSDANPPRIVLPDLRGKVFAPGETIMAQAVVKSGNGSDDGRCPSWCGPCKRFGHASADNHTTAENEGLAGAWMLVGGIAGVGGFAFRKRRRHTGGRGPSA
jgi:hypothetical protein